MSTGFGVLSTVIVLSSGLLAGGDLLSRLFARRPARAHLLLLLSIVAAVLGSYLAGFVLLAMAPPAEAVHGPPPPITGGALEVLACKLFFLEYWLLASLAVGLSLLLAFREGYRFMRHSHPVTDRLLETAALEAARRLGLRQGLRTRWVADLRCPMIWCWGPRPVLLLPEATEGALPLADWTSIMVHELAHWRRADHLSTLCGELAVILLPWNPLAWLARQRLRQLAEKACDDWALALSSDSLSYASALITLAAQPRPSIALAAVSGRSSLLSRVRHILNEQPGRPTIGPLFRLAALVLVAGTAVSLLRAMPRVDYDRATSVVVQVGSALGDLGRWVGELLDGASDHLGFGGSAGPASQYPVESYDRL